MKRPKPKVFLTADEELQIRRTYNHAQPNAWFGSWPIGWALTIEQVNQLAERGLDTDTERLDVHVCTSQTQWHVGLRAPQPWRLVSCPIIGREKDGRLQVIAPSGELKRVWPSGEQRKPWPYPGEKIRAAAHPGTVDLPA